METLIVITETGTEKYLLNTKINQEVLEKQINNILDSLNVLDWYIVDGWEIERTVQTPLHIKHNPSY